VPDFLAENFLNSSGIHSWKTKKINIIATGDVFGILVENLETYPNDNIALIVLRS
jgi:hypothetical protein